MAVAGTELYPRTGFPDARILVADRSFDASELLASVLERGGFKNVLPVSRTADLPRFVNDLEPHVLILSLAAPGGSHLATLRHLASESKDRYRIVALGSPAENVVRRRAFEFGASEYIEQPFDPVELLHRLERQVREQMLLNERRRHWAEAAEEVRALARVAERAQIETASLLASFVEELDGPLGEHSWRVARISGTIATVMGLDAKFVEDLRRAARLHDIGRVLTSATGDGDGRPGTMELPTAIGGMFLSGAFSPLMHMAARIAQTHQERWDGSGVPLGLKGLEIPLEGRIVAVADAFDTLLHGSCDGYREQAIPTGQALDEIEKLSGAAYDPDVVTALGQIHGRREVE